MSDIEDYESEYDTEVESEWEDEPSTNEDVVDDDVSVPAVLTNVPRVRRFPPFSRATGAFQQGRCGAGFWTGDGRCSGTVIGAYCYANSNSGVPVHRTQNGCEMDRQCVTRSPYAKRYSASSANPSPGTVH